MSVRLIPEKFLNYFNELHFTLSVIFTANIPVVVIREEGINGDREMAASLMQAGFEVWDATMQDLLQNKITFDKFKGVIFPGGFSYAGKLVDRTIIVLCGDSG